MFNSEGILSKANAIELLTKKKLNNLAVGKFLTLSEIHRQVFSGVYDWAGKVRSENISKGGFLFAPVKYLPEVIQEIENMPQKNFDEIIEKYVEMNVAHPFREGNGRSLRIWLNHMLAEKIKKVVDWSQITKEDYMKAMMLSLTDSTKIKSIVAVALTGEVYDQELIKQRIEVSWKYEEDN